MSLLKVEGLKKSFSSGGMWSGSGKQTHAVDDVSFNLGRGETLAIVGESGSGKSTTARLVMRLLDADAGRISLLGEDVTRLKGSALRKKRRHMQMVFQDPFASLNPRMKVGESVGEGLRVHAPQLSAAERRSKAGDMLVRCGMDGSVMDRYPHQFSGGQRQRIGIARALAVSPDLLVLDEPVSALDVSVQAQILNLLADLQQEHQLAYLFISHDLSVVSHVADRVAVMFAGRIVEQGSVQTVYGQPLHPYTRELLDARPVAHPSLRHADGEGIVRSDAGVADSGCLFRLRCSFAESDCAGFEGALSPHGSSSDTSSDPADGHRVACLHPL